MSLLPNQTNVSPSTFFFALSGAGPGSTISSFNTLTTSTFTVSSIQANGGPLSFYNMGNIDVASDVDITVRSANIDIPNSVIINAPLSQVEVSSIIGSNTRFVNTANQSSITIAQLISTVLG